VSLNRPGRVQGDRLAIREAIRNLIDNAIRHTPAGSTVRVTIGPGAAVTVEDDGPGLLGELTDDLFRPFRKVDASGDRAGLGLAIVRQAVELHRGSINVGRSPLGGAMFRLQFA
jgi:signal transduction histidine kinase